MERYSSKNQSHSTNISAMGVETFLVAAEEQCHNRIFTQPYIRTAHLQWNSRSPVPTLLLKELTKVVLFRLVFTRMTMDEPSCCVASARSSGTLFLGGRTVRPGRSDGAGCFASHIPTLVLPFDVKDNMTSENETPVKARIPAKYKRS